MTKQVTTLAFLAMLAAAAPLIVAQPGAPSAGLLIKNGQLIDGTGTPARAADIRVAGDAIVEVGGSLATHAGERVIDAHGQVVSPGFIDMHSHADRGLNETPDAATQVMQGITTAVVGQDGGGDLPVAEFYTNIERLHPAINFATFVGHGTVRSVVLGGDFKRTATPAEIETMKALVDRGMRDGALGLSSGLEYDPGHYSKTDELIALGSVVAKYGGLYSSHVRNENEGAFDAWREAIEIGRRNRIPVEISHIKLGIKPVWGRAAEGVKLLEDARREGVGRDGRLVPVHLLAVVHVCSDRNARLGQSCCVGKGLRGNRRAPERAHHQLSTRPVIERDDARRDCGRAQAGRGDNSDRHDAYGGAQHAA